MTVLIQNFVGGLGNQIFMILNAISLSIDYNLDLYLNMQRYDSNRKDFTQYIIFDNVKLKRTLLNNFDEYTLIKQNGLKYNEIKLNSGNNYLLNKEISGYFQCWKFFWHNKDKLKEYFNIYNNRFIELGNIIKNMGKTIALHIRLTDYVGNNFYVRLDKNYYENILNGYNLDEYIILLFSDDVLEATIMLNDMTCLKNKRVILANSISDDDEEQFILFCYTNIRICPNSSYSLTACYITEIFNLVETRKYHFPNKWYNLSNEHFLIEELVNTTDEHFVLNNS